MWINESVKWWEGHSKNRLLTRTELSWHQNKVACHVGFHKHLWTAALACSFATDMKAMFVLHLFSVQNIFLVQEKKKRKLYFLNFKTINSDCGPQTSNKHIDLFQQKIKSPWRNSRDTSLCDTSTKYAVHQKPVELLQQTCDCCTVTLRMKINACGDGKLLLCWTVKWLWWAGRAGSCTKGSS